ncbi:cytochrome c oxidase subunit 6C-1-like [Glandiceps talaboti]
MSLVRPQMRGLLKSKIKRDIVIGTVLAFIGAGIVKYGMAEPRKRAYADFYKDYDDQKAFEAMKEAGVFHSARPEGEVAEED